MNAKELNVRISQYAFVILVIVSILSSIWVIIYDLHAVKQAQQDYPDDIYINEKHEGHYAKYWFIACVVVVVIVDLISLFALYGAYKESSQIVMPYSVFMFIIAVYGAWDKYMKGSVTSFLLPSMTGIVGILYASLNHIHIYDGHFQDSTVKYMVKSKPQPDSRNSENNYEQFEKLKQTEP